MSRNLHHRITRLERAALNQDGPEFVVSCIPLPDSPEEQERAISEAIRSGKVVRGRFALVPAQEMTAEEWTATYCQEGGFQ